MQGSTPLGQSVLTHLPSAHALTPVLTRHHATFRPSTFDICVAEAELSGAFPSYNLSC